MAQRPIVYAITDSGCYEVRSHRLSYKGYPVVRIGSKTTRVARMLWKEQKGPIPDGFVIRHTCDNRACINIEHFEIGTPAQNSADMVLRGRAHRKLTPLQVARILSSQKNNRQLAREFGVTRQCVQSIRKRKNWRIIPAV